MSTFLIDAENNITALDSPDDAEAGQTFTSNDELGQLVAGWPASRLIEVWNSIPGLTPVRKFRDRSTAVSRIWRAIQSLNGTVQTEAATHRKRRPAKTGQSPKSKQGKPEPRGASWSIIAPPFRPFFTAGTFYGIDELTHVHRHPTEPRAVVNCFNLEDRPVERQVAFSPARFGLDAARSYKITGGSGSQGGSGYSIRVAIPRYGHTLLEIA